MPTARNIQPREPLTRTSIPPLMATTDFVEKYRSLAVFGGIAGGLFLVGFAAIFIAIDHDDIEAVKVAKREMVRDQDQALADAQAAIVKQQTLLAVLDDYRTTERKLRDTEIKCAAADGLATDLRAGNDGLRQQIDALQAELVAYRDRYRQFARLGAKGEKLGTLTTASGKSFEQAAISEVDAVGVRVIHSAGKTRIPYEELPPALQDRFQFDPAQRDALLAQESAVSAAHGSAADAATAAQQVQRKETAVAERTQHQEETEQALAGKKEDLSMINAELLQLGRDLADEQRKTSRNTGPIKARIAAKQQQRTSLQAEISRLQSEL